MKKITYLLLPLLFLFSCNNEENNNDLINNISVDEEIEEAGDGITVYTIPSPIMIANILSLYDIDFNAEIIDDSRNTEHLSNYSKALNLGVNIVDFSYSSIFNQTQTSINNLNEIDHYLSELNIQNKESFFVMERFSENISNPDTMSSMIIEFQNKLNEYYSDEKDDEISLLIIAGVYIEGLHIALDYYDEIVGNKLLAKNHQVEGYKNLILQHDIYLDNIEDLLKKYKDEENTKLFEYFDKLKAQFEKLNISYTINETSSKIEDIKYQPEEIANLKELIAEIKEYIVTA